MAEATTQTNQGEQSTSENVASTDVAEDSGSTAEVQAAEGTEAKDIGPNFVEPWADLVDDLDQFSEEQLSGVDPEATEEEEAKTESEESADGKQKTAPASESEDKSEESAETAASEDDESEEKEVREPEGYVKLEALHQARGENRYLKSVISQLKEDLEAKPEPIAADPELEWMRDFKVLSDSELEELSEDSPMDAVKYVNRLAKYNDYQRQAGENKAKEEAARVENEILINTAFEQISHDVPGIYDQNSTVAADLADFAESIGFSEDMFVLTNPRNTITIDGGATMPLGSIAANLVSVLHSLNQAVSEQFDGGSTTETTSVSGDGGSKPGMKNRNNNPGGVDIEAIKAELREEILGEVQKSVISKLKGQDSTGVKTLSDVQNSGNENFSEEMEVKSMEQWEKLTPEQQQQMLSGRQV